MNWKQVKQQWPTVQAVVKRTWGRIDEADLAMIHGERDSFVRVLSQRYSYPDALAQQKVDAFVDGLQVESKKRNRLGWLARLLEKVRGRVHVASRR
ncbi:CsbD family protein [Rubripirellula reticaptiva]|uniref:CsbD-like domain-containing protein n=1 Tax=Rubripirellula reticaptiva TaxID=2528013 RepID=A0A5C6EE76_9BACT|nr:hypothetical protein [Rubripirellula reticaptiva]TWU46960.1 hypothetical protein Poly59_59340 [Rubripirellula reticaptiva]